MMQKQIHDKRWLTILLTAVITTIVVTALLYTFGFLVLPWTENHVMGDMSMDHAAHMADSVQQLEMRQAEVAALGEEVMPFDLERTTHIFDKKEFGGVQQVLSNDNDPEQIALIQMHLEEEQARFQQGDFGDPAHIHGTEMAGLAALEAGFADVDISYVSLPDGGQLTYTSGDPALVQAIHDWFDAQLADHGSHAMESN